MTTLTRRSLLVGLGAALAGPAAAQAPAAFSSVAVDIVPLLRRGAGPEVEFIRAVMEDELRRVLAGRIGGRGRRLVVRLQTIQFTGSPSGSPNFRGSDYLDGELRQDVLELKQRIGHLEGQYATISNRIDRVDNRLDRIERRFDLVDS